MQSGSAATWPPTESSQPIFDNLALEMGCGSSPEKIQCMRGVPIAKVMEATNKLPGVCT